MAERRAIKSKIWDDEFYGELSFFEQVVWIGLFSRCADDQGRLPDNAQLISSQLFPYKGVPADDIEQGLVTFGDHILRYTVNGKAYIQLVKWWENQPLQYAVPSNYPAPDGWIDRYRTTYKGQHIVYNWEGMGDTELGTLLYMKLKSLARVSSWTDQVGTLNTNTNTNNNPNPNTDDGGALMTAEAVQAYCEKLTGIMPTTPADIKALDAMAAAELIGADIKNGYQWLTVDQGRTFRSYSSLVNPAGVAKSKRIQQSNGNGKRADNSMAEALAKLERGEL